MQAWGSGSRFDERRTELEPTKSGVVGLLAAALGRDRAEPIADLAALRMGVRVDSEGTLQYDYQTAQQVRTADGRRADRPVASRRYFLADAAFLVGLEGSDLSLLDKAHAALARPRWALFLGRKSYVPSEPVFLPNGIREQPLEEALAGYPALVARPPSVYRYVLEASTGALRMDQPIAPFSVRRFGARFVWVGTAAPGEVPHVY
jgi:CRISPR system Cascade subunit CasD